MPMTQFQDCNFFW